MAPPPVDPTLYADSSWPAQYQCRHSDARRASGRGESPLGCASDPRRIGQTRYRRLGADRLAALTAAPSSAVADMAYLPDESSDIPGVAGLLHRTDGHRTRAVRARAAVPSQSAYRPSPDHGASHGGVDGPATHRGISRGIRPALAPARSGRHLWDLFRGRVAGMGIHEVISAPSSPWQNPYVERLSDPLVASVSITSSSSTRCICGARSPDTSPTITVHGPISRWRKTRRRLDVCKRSLTVT
jgi:hypothetical protein